MSFLLCFLSFVLCALLFCSSHFWLDLLTFAQCCSDCCVFELSLPFPQSRSLVMTVNNVWVSAYFPHICFGQMRWCKRSGRKNARTIRVRGEPASRHSLAVLQRQPPATRRTKPLSLRPLLSLRPRRHRGLLPNASAWMGTPRPTRTGPTNQVSHRGKASRLHGFPAVVRRRHHLTAVAHPQHRPCVCRLASSHLQRLTQMTASWASRQWTARCVYGWTKSVPSTERITAIGLTLGASNSPLRRAGMTHFWRTFTRIANRHLTTLFRSHTVVRHLHYAVIKKTGGRLRRFISSCNAPSFWPTRHSYGQRLSNDSRCVLHIAVRRHDARSRLLLE